MNANHDPALKALVDRVQAARADKTPLNICGGGSKTFYGEWPQGITFDVTGLGGISSYEPSELVVTARAGTPLSELESTLAEKGQCLPFEPPRFGDIGMGGGTVGGMVAAGLAGPARAAVGGVRDYVLGAVLLNGRAEVLSLGGQVIKNVAGYDLSRVLAGSLGTLGVICEVSLKVLPIAPATLTLRIEADQASAIRRVNEWGGQPLPLNASAWWDGMLVLRLSGAVAAVQAAQKTMGGDVVDAPMATAFWQGLRDHADEFFMGAAKAVQSGAGLWRLSVPATTPPLKLPGEQLLEWGGAQRWICTSAPAALLRDAAAAAGGHAVLFRAGDRGANKSAAPTVGRFAPLKPPLDRIHHEMKLAFDPDGIFNPGRLYPGL
jgi:glycolate oxidase FAD binding subunit